MKTRAKRSTGTTATSNTSSTPAKPSTTLKTLTIPADQQHPPQVFILPDAAAQDPAARVLTLSHPASAVPARFLVSPATASGGASFYEFTRVAAPKRAAGQRSWLLAPNGRRRRDGTRRSDDGADGREASREPREEGVSTTAVEKDAKTQTSVIAPAQPTDDTADLADDNTGYVLQTPDLFIATPFDPLFLLLPSLAAGLASSSSSSSAQEFLAPSDHIAQLLSSAPHLKSFLLAATPDHNENLRGALAERLKAVCDEIDMSGDGSDVVYALSLKKVAGELLGKAQRMIKSRSGDENGASGLPASMEEKFVRSVLEAPTTLVVDDEAGVARKEEEARQQQKNKDKDDAAAAATTATDGTTASSKPPAPSAPAIDPQILHLQRLRVALTYLQSSYLPPHLPALLAPLLRDPRMLPGGVDFAPLDAHVAKVAALRKEAVALRAMSENIVPKRRADDGEGESGGGARKRKREGEDGGAAAKKANAPSVGLRKLAKADTSGMKKLSAFFGKKA